MHGARGLAACPHGPWSPGLEASSTIPAALPSSACRARREGQSQAQAAWDKERAALQAELERLARDNSGLRHKLQEKTVELSGCKHKLERVREQRNGLARELGQLQGGLKRMASGRR